MGSMGEVGARIRSLMPDGMSQRELADRAGMTPDALSRALSAQRGLSPLEVAAIAQTLGADTHWLITGAPDPFAVSVAARHAWDARTRERINPGRQDDQPALAQVAALYRGAYPQGPAPSVELPPSPDAVRDLLAPPFVSTFADVVERRLGIDVIRIPGLRTDYAIRIGGRGVIVLATQSSWFRSNWSLAHELGHLALAHHSTYDSPRKIRDDEKTADAFAAALLLPVHVLEELVIVDDERVIASLVWGLGVSTEAVRNALRKAKLTASPIVTEALTKATPRLLRDNAAVLRGDATVDPVITREQAASARRFPAPLLSALQTQIDIGAASPELLAWALDVPVDDIDFPDASDDNEEYEAMLAGRPSASQWRSMISGTTASS